MKKKLSKICALTLCFLLSITSFAFATTSNNSDATKITFSKNTVITEENMDEILTYYGLDPENVLPNDGRIEKELVTVGDLEKALDDFKNLPKEIIIEDKNAKNINITENENNISILSTGSSTVASSFNMGSMGITVKATGYYFSGGEERYWYQAIAGDVDVSSLSAYYAYEITDINYITCQVYNPYQYSSYLKTSYSVTYTTYAVILGMLVELGSAPLSGYSQFDVSYIPG